MRFQTRRTDISYVHDMIIRCCNKRGEIYVMIGRDKYKRMQFQGMHIDLSEFPATFNLKFCI